MAWIILEHSDNGVFPVDGPVHETREAAESQKAHLDVVAEEMPHIDRYTVRELV